MRMVAGFAIFLITIFRSMCQHNPKKFRFTPAQLPQYCRDLPDDRPAPAVDRLVHFYDGSPNVSRQISATLPESNVQELIMLQAVDDDVELVLDTRQGEKLFPFFYNAHTPDYQEALWSLLVNAAGDQGRITMKKLRQYIRDNQETAWNFHNSFISAVNTEYQKLVRTETVKRPFFGGTRICWILSAVAGVLAALVRMFSSLYNGIEVDVSTCVGVTAFVLLALMVFVFCLGRKFGRGRFVLLIRHRRTIWPCGRPSVGIWMTSQAWQTRTSRIFPSGGSPWSTLWRWAMDPGWPTRCA